MASLYRPVSEAKISAPGAQKKGFYTAMRLGRIGHRKNLLEGLRPGKHQASVLNTVQRTEAQHNQAALRRYLADVIQPMAANLTFSLSVVAGIICTGQVTRLSFR
jgi:hypothetical protein